MLPNINGSYLLYAHANVISKKYYSNIHMQITVLEYVAVVINCIAILYKTMACIFYGGFDRNQQHN
jgi:hypothetical protein